MLSFKNLHLFYNCVREQITARRMRPAGKPVFSKWPPNPMALDSCFAFGLHLSSAPVSQALNSLSLVKGLQIRPGDPSPCSCALLQAFDLCFKGSDLCLIPRSFLPYALLYSLFNTLFNSLSYSLGVLLFCVFFYCFAHNLPSFLFNRQLLGNKLPSL